MTPDQTLPCPTRPSRHRRGLTLFELLLALAIFLSSLAALAHLIHAGNRAAVQGRLRNQAIIRCESKMAELLSGVQPLESVSRVRFSDDENWSWTADVRQGPLPELIELRVMVMHSGNSTLANSSFTLKRYTRDPRLFQRRTNIIANGEPSEIQEAENDPTDDSSSADRDG